MQRAYEYIKAELRSVYTDSELQNISYLLFEKLTGLSRAQLLINKSTTFSMEQRKELESFVEKLKKYTPIQYILGNADFFGLEFEVNESVLIPRPETEELVEWIMNENPTDSPLRMLDIGTGSGCIAVALKKVFPTASVHAYDISAEAIKLATKNAESNNLSVNFKVFDILNPESTDDHWDIIVSNPPYIPEKEKVNMHSNVLDYEPHLALFVPDEDPLLFYRKIADFASTHLRKGGKLYFEIHYDAGNHIVKLLRERGFSDVELRQDLSGNDRMVRAALK